MEQFNLFNIREEERNDKGKEVNKANEIDKTNKMHKSDKIEKK